MMLKIILYAYTNRIYSSRQIAKQLGENIYFMWLSENQKPDFRTINRFRSERMKDVIYETFFSLVDLLRQEGLVKLEDYFLDGTKIEANANKYTFVWR
ncbi:transposase, partial [Aneurinibacillus migulanus]